MCRDRAAADQQRVLGMSCGFVAAHIGLEDIGEFVVALVIAGDFEWRDGADDEDDDEVVMEEQNGGGSEVPVAAVSNVRLA